MRCFLLTGEVKPLSPPPGLPFCCVGPSDWSMRCLALDPSSVLYLQHKPGPCLDALQRLPSPQTPASFAPAPPTAKRSSWAQLQWPQPQRRQWDERRRSCENKHMPPGMASASSACACRNEAEHFGFKKLRVISERTSNGCAPDMLAALLASFMCQPVPGYLVPGPSSHRRCLSVAKRWRVSASDQRLCETQRPGRASMSQCVAV
jgi:hypothetical protein